MRKLLILIFIILFVSCNNREPGDGHVLARVESSALTLAEADRLKLAISNQNYTMRDVVANWIDRELLYLAAKHSGLENDDNLKTQINIYKKELFGNTFMDNHIASQISIKNTDIRAYYDQNRSSFIHKKDGARIIHFFSTVDSVAQYITNILVGSDEFVDRKKLLSDHNVGVTSVEKDELLGQLNAELFTNNRINYIIGPVKTDYGYHIIEVLGRYKAGSQIDIDEAYDEIYQRLFNQKKALRAISVLDSLRNHYSIKINFENI